jgi:hypothetical protein
LGHARRHHRLGTVTLQRIVGVVRIAAATTGIVALIGRYVYGLDFVTFSTANFFGYLTIQSNVAGVCVFSIGGALAVRGRDDAEWVTVLRAIVTTCLTVAGVVFALLVSQASAQAYYLEVPWSDVLLHFVLPVVAVADWIVTPGRQRVPWRLIPLVVGYPIVWGMSTMVRGSIVGWYPYFFLDPLQVTIGQFAILNAAALSFFALVMTTLLLVARFVPPVGALRRR